MEGVTISKYGLSFVAECLKGYLGESWEIFMICLVGMAAETFIWASGRKHADGKVADPGRNFPVTWMNWAILILFALTLWNPFLVRMIVPRLGMTPVYYRVFWAFPMVFLAAYYLTLFIFRIRRKALGAFLALAVFASAAAVMPLNPGIRYHLDLPDNLYKVSGAIPVICDAIHEDFEKTDQYQLKMDKADGLDPLTKRGARSFVRTLPRCVFPYELEFQVRQYDPSVALTFSRDMRLSYEGSTATGVTYTGESKAYARRKIILDAMYGRDPSIETEDFQDAMKRTKTNYLIVEQDKANRKFLEKAGCRLAGSEAGYHIYSYGLTAKDQSKPAA